LWVRIAGLMTCFTIWLLLSLFLSKPALNICIERQRRMIVHRSGGEKSDAAGKTIS
jgi:hypothetical protein